MRVHVGTSGYSYKEWKGSFYPEKIRPDAMLAYYASRLGAVEINNTFYRMPKAEVLAAWAAEVPGRFSFVLKAPGSITHRKQLEPGGPILRAFCEAAQAMGPKLGAFLLQLPPFLEKDVAMLDAFLAALAKLPNAPPRVALEFRNGSWLVDQDGAVGAMLHRHGAALCLAESDDASAPLDLGARLGSTADWGYLRLRRTDYTDDELTAWVARLRAQKWKEVYVFLKHEDEGKGPAFATKLRALTLSSTRTRAKRDGGASDAR